MIRLLVILFLGLACLPAYSAKKDNTHSLPRSSPIPGGLVLVRTVTATQPEPEAYYSGERVALVKASGYWTAIIGLSLDTSPGDHVLYTVAANGVQNTYPFRVKDYTYPRQNLHIKNKRLVTPGTDDFIRIEKEFLLIKSVFEKWTPTDEYNFSFSLPVKGRFSSRFGLRRFFNNEPRNPHSGIDIAAPMGTKIRAPANGSVLLTGNFFFNGNTVFIDHGRGLIGMYNHLNTILVSPGEKLVRGQTIGTVGNTGRVTGPHLHWTVSLNNARINPLLMLNEEGRKDLGVK